MGRSDRSQYSDLKAAIMPLRRAEGEPGGSPASPASRSPAAQGHLHLGEGQGDASSMTTSDLEAPPLVLPMRQPIPHILAPAPGTFAGGSSDPNSDPSSTPFLPQTGDPTLL